MFDILVKAGLGEHYGVFLEQNITPDIVCCLAAIEMQQLCISTKKDMVKLRSECANYGIRKLQMSQSECGPPNFMIPKDVLENLIDEGFAISKIAKLLSVSEVLYFVECDNTVSPRTSFQLATTTSLMPAWVL